jgi:T-complex protein 1 subunit alpha
MSGIGVGIIGERAQGIDVRIANTTAVQAIANIVKTSLGPQGLDKMLVDEIGDICITNDGATILRQLEVEHPAAQVLVELAHLQDKEVGDGTTSVVILAGELLRRATELIKNKIHPTTILKGYKIAQREAEKYIESSLSRTVDQLGKESLISVARTSMSSKLIGSESVFFADMAVKACCYVKTTGGKVPVKNIHIVKSHGQSSLESIFFEGYVLQMSRVSQQMKGRIDGVKVACLDMNLNKFRLGMGTSVQIDDPKNLEKVRQREMDILKERINRLIEAGANLILTTKALDDQAAKYLVEAGAIGLRRIEKTDMRRIARLTGATVVTTFATSEGEEGFDKSMLGELDAVYEEAVGDNDFVFLKAKKGNNSSCSILLRGANEYMTDEIDRSLHDSLCVIKRTIESGSVVAGGGAVEVALNIYLENFASKLSSKEQIAISEFADALLIIPKVLSCNAVQDSAELVSKLRVLHNAVQNANAENNEKFKDVEFSGLDLVEGKIRNNLQAGVLEPMMSKLKSIAFATEAAMTIIRIDDMIRLAPEEEEQMQRR